MPIILRGLLRKSEDSIDYEFSGKEDLLPEGEYIVHILLKDEDVVRAKKAYFAMVTELAKFAGYVSHKERELFKGQVKDELGGESIADMLTTEEVHVKIEELHQLAKEHYDYFFPPYLKPLQ